MRSAGDDIYYLFNILVAAIACAALALGLLNYREIKEIKSKIEILERKIDDNKISISEIQKKKRELTISPVHARKIKPEKKHPPGIISSKRVPETESNNMKKKIIIKVNNSQQEKKKRSLDSIVTDLVDVVIK